MLMGVKRWSVSKGGSQGENLENGVNLTDHPAPCDNLSGQAEHETHHRNAPVQLFGEHSEALWDLRCLDVGHLSDDGASLPLGGGYRPCKRRCEWWSADLSDWTNSEGWSVDESRVHFRWDRVEYCWMIIVDFWVLVIEDYGKELEKAVPSGWTWGFILISNELHNGSRKFKCKLIPFQSMGGRECSCGRMNEMHSVDRAGKENDVHSNNKGR